MKNITLIGLILSFTIFSWANDQNIRPLENGFYELEIDFTDLR